ncbi:MAG: radical SAM protein [Halioglobus sp.]|nr:radical SAM protein [Halioglobus sp.]
MSTQVNILPQLTGGPAPRTVVGLVSEGPRFIGFNNSKVRLRDQVAFGRLLSLGHLELLFGLGTSEEKSDAELVNSIRANFDVKPDQLKNITRAFRALQKADDEAQDAWRPPTPTPPTEEPNEARIADAIGATRLLAPHVPLLFRVGNSGFEHVSHSGKVDLSLTARELSALRHFTAPATIAEITQRVSQSEENLSAEEVKSLLERFACAGVLRSFEPEDPGFEIAYQGDAKRKRQEERVTQALHDAIKRAEERNPRRRDAVSVFPVNIDWQIVPLALGFLFSAARAHDGGRLTDSFDFRPNWLTDVTAPVPDGPMVMLHSHYIWNSAGMLACSARVKAANPLALNIHGGPDVPKYEPDVERYFHDHPYVDIAVHGEGEITICEILETLETALLSRNPVDLTLLDGVTGLSYRGTDGVPVRTADRPRIKDLNDIPSPYLTGEFEVFAEAGVPSVIMETNRGCPYGCTFCDWGSATASKIRKFDLERVFAEFEWCARNKIESIGLADANFGTFQRDVEIAKRTAELKKTYGYPMELGTNYAKNSVKYLKPIVDTLVKGNIIAKGLLSLQSMDEDTLSVINRANIRLSKYEALAAEFRANKLPLYVDLMMGLPGSTIKSFCNDLQECVDREVYPKVHPTQLLVNSPMNEPAYREQYGIKIGPSEMLTSCATFTEDDYAEMTKIRRIYLVAEKFGILRHALRYARQETGQREIDLLTRLMVAVDNDGDRWPALRFTFLYVPAVMVPPVDWGWFMADLHRFFVEQLGIPDDAALDSALRAQHAMIPAPERQFPETIELPCDYAAWHADVLTAKENGHLQDWFKTVAPLRSYGAGILTVTDPNQICEQALGRSFNSYIWSLWELSSEIARPSDGAITA